MGALVREGGGGERRRPGCRLLTPPHLPFALRGARTGSRPGCRPRRRPEPWGVASKSSSPQRLRLIRSRTCWASSDTGSLASLPSLFGCTAGPAAWVAFGLGDRGQRGPWEAEEDSARCCLVASAGGGPDPGRQPVAVQACGGGGCCCCCAEVERPISLASLRARCGGLGRGIPPSPAQMAPGARYR
jgi:hypothetical protein